MEYLLYETFAVSFSLVRTRLQTLVKVLNSVCYWFPRNIVPLKFVAYVYGTA